MPSVGFLDPAHYDTHQHAVYALDPSMYRFGESWTAPPEEEYKSNVDGSTRGKIGPNGYGEGKYRLNVDGSTRDKLGPTGCDGVLEDSSSYVIGIFFSPLEIQDSSYVELMAIKHALLLFASSTLAGAKGEYKFNVDGSTGDKLGPTGCHGVLRDSSSYVIGIFFSPLEIQDSSHVEIMAIKHALLLFASSPLVGATFEMKSKELVNN
ncbi:Uncharacterized protein TCM_007917 [Theobroma cacao]|uniref:Uncharacterized protein n=1 Tax=Theobroma cacao TaxID=3641 RepID=A0A061E3T9_THECC|nr:Uncharacterized protein TCM_007917 [Theobroma cacao]